MCAAINGFLVGLLLCVFRILWPLILLFEMEVALARPHCQTERLALQGMSPCVCVCVCVCVRVHLSGLPASDEELRLVLVAFGTLCPRDFELFTRNSTSVAQQLHVIQLYIWLLYICIIQCSGQVYYGGVIDCLWDSTQPNSQAVCSLGERYGLLDPVAEFMDKCLQTEPAHFRSEGSTVR